MATMVVSRGISRACVCSFMSSSVGPAAAAAAAAGEGEKNSRGRRALFACCSLHDGKRIPQHCLRRVQATGSKSLRTVLRVTETSSGINMEQKVEAAVADFILDGSKTTSIAHKVWRSVVRPGDTVIDATCGNGYDTLMLAKLVFQEGSAGYVIGLDLQQSAIDNTTALLDRDLEINQIDRIVDEASVRLVCFNLGYQPGGDKSFITKAESTVNAVRAATKVIEQQGLISIMSYVGHPGGQEEYEAVRDFVADLPPSEWVCSHLEWTNRPLCPHLIFLLRK